VINTFYIETMGCQMNKLDSELVAGQLQNIGYHPTDDPTEAAVIIFNTCSVRQHAEDKVISKIGQLRRRHQQQKDLILAVIGCMAQRLGQELLDSHQQVDIVCGPGQIHQLSKMIADIQNQRQRLLNLNDPAENEKLENLDTSRQHHDSPIPFMAYVRVMRGCNNFCSYCIVPYVRGRERSRPIEHIVDECRRLTENGVKEITLLGQTVNSYKYQNDNQTFTLADVMENIHDRPGLARIRFVTDYPRNFDERILHAMADLPKVCEYLHIPAQSGSDRILKAMNRHYTADDYSELIQKARDIVPGITIAGDFIVGYCNEDDQDFNNTKALVQKIRYKNCFIFKYSPRPGTRADDKMIDNVPDPIKRQRNIELLELQNQISYEDNQKLIGKTVEILVEGPSKKPHLNIPKDQLDPENPLLQLTGRTPGDQIVVFNGTRNLIGQIINTKIEKASALTLFGNYLSP